MPQFQKPERLEKLLSAPIGPVVSPSEEGDPASKICILGEAPSIHEMRLRRPLVGESGTVFNQLCHNAGLLRRELYIVNTFPMQLDKNEARTKMWIRGHSDQVLWEKSGGFTDLGWKYASQALVKIRKSQANVIVALGGTATSALLQHVKSISKWRGSVCLSDQRTGLKRKVIPTYHPAALVWGSPYVWRYDIIADLRKAKKFSKVRAFDLKEPTLIIRPKFKDVMEYMRECRRAGLFNTDIETYRPWVSCFSLAYKTDEAMCIPFVDGDGQPYWSFDDEVAIQLEYGRLMSDKKITKVNQNILFDAWCLYLSNRIITLGRMEDPMTMQAILHPDFPKKLEYITSIFTDMPYYKDDKKLWKNFWKDIDVFWRYNAKDSPSSLMCYLELNKEIDEKGYRQQYEDYLSDFPSLYYMMVRGVKVDATALAKTQKHVDGLIEAKEKELAKVADYPFNPASAKQVLQYFYIHKDIKPYINMKTKKPTVDDYALQRLWRTHHLQEAKIMQEIRRLNKLKGTYYDVEYDEDSRIRTTYTTTPTTGRLSSTKTVFDTGMNMQNLDPEFKHFIVPG